MQSEKQLGFVDEVCWFRLCSRLSMAGPESQRLSSEMEHDMILDTTVSETRSAGFTASPLPKTPIGSRPTSHAPQSPTDIDSDTDSDIDSDSDYSQSESPTNSRPTSFLPQSVDDPFEEVSLEEKPQSQTNSLLYDSPAETSNGSSSDSMHLQNNVLGAVKVEEMPQSPTSFGSGYSEHSTTGSRSASIHPRTSVGSVPIEVDQASREEMRPTETKTPSQQWDLLANSTQTSQQVVCEIDTSSLRPVSLLESEEPSSEPQTPRITVSPLSQSPEGSDYSGSPPQSPNTPTVPLSPMTPEQAHMSMDSLQSIALSETSLDYDHLSADQVDDVLATPRVSSARHMGKPSSLEILQNTWAPPSRQSTLFDTTKDEPLGSPVAGPEESYNDSRNSMMDTTVVWRSESSSSLASPKRGSGSSESEVELDWSALDKTEEQEKEDKDLPAGAEDESTAFLLARLEQENAKFTTDPKSTPAVAVRPQISRMRSKSRPPSMAHLKKLVTKQDTPSIRYSLASDVQEQVPLEDPPPMTELEFWAALVQDYPSTASRLPTLTTTKIRAGIPPPLRGVVWTSMSGARDRMLEQAFEQLQNEQSPYEGIINKDVGRSFPGVELFRDAEGEGQKMLGRVLKCYSLHDKDIGYCQGLGFLVGPLLMNMGEREAFCVLVR